jgi:hypothetical protein
MHLHAGYIGLHTGMRPGAFSISVDSRFDSNFDVGFIKWLHDPTHSAQFLTLATRATMEQNHTVSASTRTRHVQSVPELN